MDEELGLHGHRVAGAELWGDSVAVPLGKVLNLRAMVHIQLYKWLTLNKKGGSYISCWEQGCLISK